MRDFDPTAGEFAGHDAIHITSRHYDMGSILGAGASLLGGAMGSDAAEDAANIQAGATREANQLQREQFNQIRSDLSPYRNLGAGATNALARLLGISMPSGPAAASAQEREAIRQRLLPQFTRTETAAQPTGRRVFVGEGDAGEWMWEGPYGTAPSGMAYAPGSGGGAAPSSTVDEAALNAAIDAELSRLYPAVDNSASPDFGSLLRNFTGEDLANEPGYQFGLDEGLKAVNNRLAAGGSYFSGAALKGATRFANDYASTKFNDAFNRDSANKTRTYNFLTGAVGTGQNAANMTGQAGANMAAQVGANTTNMANAAGAARIAGGNAWSNALQGAVGGYQQNQLLNRVLGGNAGWGGGESWRTTGSGMPSWYQA